MSNKKQNTLGVIGGGHKNYENDYQSDYQQSEKGIGLSADNPEPEYNRKGLFIALVKFFLLAALTGFIGYEIGNSISIQEEEVMPARICTPVDTEENNVTIHTISEKNIFYDGHVVTTIDLVLSDGSVNDTIHFEKQF